MFTFVLAPSTTASARTPNSFATFYSQIQLQNHIHPTLHRFATWQPLLGPATRSSFCFSAADNHHDDRVSGRKVSPWICAYNIRLSQSSRGIRICSVLTHRYVWVKETLHSFACRSCRPVSVWFACYSFRWRAKKRQSHHIISCTVL